VRLKGTPPPAFDCWSRREFLQTALALCGSGPALRGLSGALSNAPDAAFVLLDPTVTGIQFKHRNGAAGGKEMIETMGSGCALLDYDNDGLLDLYFVNGAALPSLRKEDPSYFNRLYRNLGGFRFADVTLAAGVQGNGYGMGVAVGDYDNDGYPDLYLTNYGSNQLLRNRGNGTFEDATVRAGVAAGGWSTSATFLDYNRDGLLDIFVTRYVEYDLGKGPYCGRPEIGRRSYCLPDAFTPSSNILYRNNGDGTFTDVSREAGISQEKGNGLGVIAADLDGDGWTDVIVANDRTRNLFFRNKGNGTFEEIGVQAGLGLSNDGVARAGMGIDVADFDQDGRMDVVISNFESEGVALFHNQGSLDFYDQSGQRGLLERSFPYVGFGIKFLDYDNDGKPDLFVANGHVLDDISYYRHGMTYPQPKLLFRNEGERFSLVTGTPATGISVPEVSRGVAVGDLDNDGNLDVIVSNNNGPPDVFRNQIGRKQNSILLKLAGPARNRDGIGTLIEAHCGDQMIRLEARCGGSYLSSHDPRVHIGVGDARQLDELKLKWPSGTSQRLTNVAGGYLYVISEEKGIGPQTMKRLANTSK
jgi:enediyne biosynthesis protein E4